VEHVLEQNTIRFYICATKNIPEGKEITMPFSYDYRKWLVHNICAHLDRAVSVLVYCLLRKLHS